MDDDNTKEENEPSTSKKENQEVNSGHDMYDGGRRDDRGSNSESSASATYSMRSQIDMADVRADKPKPIIGKKRAQKKKKRGRRLGGKVEKRRRSLTRRQVGRKMKRRPKIRDEKKKRDLSVCTLFTRTSTRSDSITSGCKYCGHRCCLRRQKMLFTRFEYEVRRIANRKYRRKRTKKVRRMKKVPTVTSRVSGSECIQVGSRSVMLSPLLINKNSIPTIDQQQEGAHCEISPEMIYQSLRRLTMWRQAVTTENILRYMQINYPVNTNEQDLLEELIEKLRVAIIAGIAVSVSKGSWRLSCCLQKRKLTETHVTLFWKTYTDTLTPVRPSVNRQSKFCQQEETCTRSAVQRDYESSGDVEDDII